MDAWLVWRNAVEGEWKDRHQSWINSDSIPISIPTQSAYIRRGATSNRKAPRFVESQSTVLKAIRTATTCPTQTTNDDPDALGRSPRIFAQYVQILGKMHENIRRTGAAHNSCLYLVQRIKRRSRKLGDSGAAPQSNKAIFRHGRKEIRWKSGSKME
jgi:hypothetical protein